MEEKGADPGHGFRITTVDDFRVWGFCVNLVNLNLTIRVLRLVVAFCELHLVHKVPYGMPESP